MWGFRRKDHWQKHMRDEHGIEKGKRTAKEEKISMAVLKGGRWVVVLEGGRAVESPGSSSSAVDVETDLVSGGSVQAACQMESERTDTSELSSS